ncbi:MAG: Hsp20/alpha crystallin family protein [Chloroflexota bacterium]|nr:Hsp20/alpha crystallin family protein [Chloroflexota bacterium]
MLVRTRKPYFRLIDDIFGDHRPLLGSANEFGNRSFGLALDVEENEERYIVRADLPGVSLEDISVNIHDDLLTISAETASESQDESKRVLVRERRVGKFSRSLRFPVPVDGDNVEASFENGVLSVVVPKAEDAKPRQIPVRVSGASN